MFGAPCHKVAEVVIQPLLAGAFAETFSQMTVPRRKGIGMQGKQKKGKTIPSKAHSYASNRFATQEGTPKRESLSRIYKHGTVLNILLKSTKASLYALETSSGRRCKGNEALKKEVLCFFVSVFIYCTFEMYIRAFFLF